MQIKENKFDAVLLNKTADIAVVTVFYDFSHSVGDYP